MSQRDELTEFLFGHIADPDGPGSDLSYTLREDNVWLAVNGNLDVQNLASDLLHAGYRKPRTITTVEELDALPDRSVVLTRHGQSIQIMRDIKPDLEWWHYIIKDAGSATVLYEPEAHHAV